MLKNTRLVIVLCASSIVTVLLLQFYWVKSYYTVNQQGFDKEVNMAFEDALKKEFSLRCDTIQHLIANRLLDTSKFRITSSFDKKLHRYVYLLGNAMVANDNFKFSSISDQKLTRPLLAGDTAFKRLVVERFARSMRNEDLQHHIIYYRTQALGNFVSENVTRFDFDTARLRPVLNRYLADRNIQATFKFYLREQDSTTNKSNFKPQLLRRYPVITRAYPTYKQVKGQQFVRAMFNNPLGYIVSRMGFMFTGSLLLILVVAFSLVYLTRLLFNEKRLSAMKNDFISNITHEFKTPIATASASIEAMTSFDVLDDREKSLRYLSHSKAELDKLAALVDKILNITVYESQQFEIKRQRLAVDDAIEAIMAAFIAHQPKQISWAYHNQTGVQELFADKTYFTYAISNVVDNAIKYAKDEVAIDITCSVVSGFFAIAVKDNGIGISTHHLPLVFEKFYRVSAGNSHPVKGHGLGLNFVKGIIEKHKGWYKLESEYGSGSTLTLAWPL